jgi:ATP-binding protein involved in chromosome partitioning
MSEFVCPGCERHTRIFSQGGAKTLSEKFQIPVLGEIPLDPRVCEAGETGTPASVGATASSTGQAFRLAAKHIAAQVSLANYRMQTLEIKTVA